MSEKKKILCLHSFRTNASILKQQMLDFSVFQDAFGPDVEFEFIDGVHKCTTADEAKMEPQLKQFFSGPYYEWLNANPTNMHVPTASN